MTTTARTSPPARPPVIPALTSLRGFLAVWVVLFHLQPDLERLLPLSRVAGPLVAAGFTAVPGFFILSGYVIWYNYRQWFTSPTPARFVRFVLLRLLRLYPVHLATLLATLALVLSAHANGVQIPDELFTRRDFVRNLFLVHTWVPAFRFNWNYPSWSISSEWFAYLCFPVVSYLLGRIGSRSALAFGVAAGVAVMVTVEVWGPGLPYRMLIGVLPTFLTGCMIAKLVPLLPPRPQLTYASDVLTLSIMAIPFLAPPAAVPAAVVAGFAAAIAALGWNGVNCSRLWSHPYSVYIGEVSYSLYMSHFLVIRVVNKVAPTTRFADAPVWVRVGVLAGYLTAVAGVALVTYYLVERPFQSYYRTRSRPKQDT